MGLCPYRSQHASFLSTANRWQCGDTDGTETYRGKQEQCSIAFTVILKTFRSLQIHPFHSIHTKTCTLHLQPHLSRRVMACRAAQCSGVLCWQDSPQVELGSRASLNCWLLSYSWQAKISSPLMRAFRNLVAVFPISSFDTEASLNWSLICLQVPKGQHAGSPVKRKEVCYQSQTRPPQ